MPGFECVNDCACLPEELLTLLKFVSHCCFPFGFLHLWVFVVYHLCSVLCFRSCSMSVYRCWVPSFLWVQWVLTHLLRAMRNAGKSPHWFTGLHFVVFASVLSNCAALSVINGWYLNFLFRNWEEKRFSICIIVSSVPLKFCSFRFSVK